MQFPFSFQYWRQTWIGTQWLSKLRVLSVPPIYASMFSWNALSPTILKALIQFSSPLHWTSSTPDGLTTFTGLDDDCTVFFVRQVIEDDLHAPQRRFRQIELVFQKTIFDTFEVYPVEPTQTERVSFIVGCVLLYSHLSLRSSSSQLFFTVDKKRELNFSQLCPVHPIRSER